MIGVIKNKIINNPKLKEYITYSFWSLIGTAISKILLMLTWVIIARILKPELYGEFSMIRSTTFIFSEFIGFSLSIAAVKFVAESLENKEYLSKIISTLLIICLVLGAVLSLIFFGLSDMIATSMIKRSDLAIYIAITSSIIFLSTFNNCQLGILRGFCDFKLIAKINLLQIIISFPILYFSTKYFGLNGAVWSYVCYYFIITVISQFYLRNRNKKMGLNIKFKLYKDEIKRVFKYVLPYFASIFIAYIAQWYNEIVLVSSSKDGFTQLGVYSAVSTIQATVIGGIIILCVPMISLMSKYKGESNIMDKLNYYIPAVMISIVLLPLLFVPETISFIYGNDYNNNGIFDLMWMVALYTPLIVFKQSIARSVAVYEKQSLFLYDCIFMAIIMIGGFYFYTDYGIKAMVAAIGFANILSILVFTPIYIKTKILTPGLLTNKIFIGGIFIYILSGSFYILLDDNIIARIAIMISMYIVIILCAYKFIKRYIK